MWTSHCVIRYVEFVQHRLIRTSLLLLVTFVLWNASDVIYANLRHLLVPSRIHKLPIEFTFVPCAAHDQNVKGASKCSFPEAVAIVPPTDLHATTSYSVSVRFQLAFPPAAANVRTFIVCMEMAGGDGGEICKPVRLTSKSKYARFADFLLLYPFDVLRHLLADGSVASATDESEIREVEFLDGFSMADGHHDRLDAKITVKDVQVDVLSADFIMHGFDSRGGGGGRLESLLRHHPDLGKSVAVCLLSFTILFCSTCFWRWLTRPEVVTTVKRTPRKQDLEATNNKEKSRFPGNRNEFRNFVSPAADETVEERGESP